MRGLFIACLAGLRLFALPAGNPMSACFYHKGIFTACDQTVEERFCSTELSKTHVGAIRYGYYGDFMFAKTMKTGRPKPIDPIDYFQVREVPKGTRLHNLQVVANGGHIAFSVCNRLDVEVGYGAASFVLESRGGQFIGPYGVNGISNNHDSLFAYRAESSSGMLWRFAGKYNVIVLDGFVCGVTSEYWRAKPALRHVCVQANPAVMLDWYDHHRVNLSAWQAAISCAWWFPIANSADSGVSPYGAIRYGGMMLDSHHFLLMDPDLIHGSFMLEYFYTSILPTLYQTRHYGLSLGVTFLFHEYASCTCEGRWYDEKGIYIDTQVRF